jgi:threonine/homoserine/homoserine lactone efflux protein
MGMPDLATLAVFVTAALALLLVPGPAVLYIVTRSVDQGRRAGIISVLGIGVGTFFHIAAAALGLSALLLSSALAFDVVKYLGAAYLIYLGIRTLRSREAHVQQVAAGRQSLRRIFSQGVIVNVLNPKTALFFFAFLPQFVNPAHGSVTAQIVFLGCVFVALGMLSDGSYALLAGTFAGRLKGSPRFLHTQRYVAGGVYISLGVAAALSGSGKHK